MIVHEEEDRRWGVEKGASTHSLHISYVFTAYPAILFLSSLWIDIQQSNPNRFNCHLSQPSQQGI